jgi:hypothetical protein
MKALMIGMATLALLSFVGGAVAQEASALGESSLRPLDITCADIMGASEAERPALVFFIAGYRAAMGQQGAMGADAGGGEGAMAVTTEDPDPAAVGAADVTNEPAPAEGDAAAAPADAAAPAADAAAADAPVSDVAAADAAGADAASPAADAAGETKTAAGAAGEQMGGAGDVQVPRAFLGTGVSDILAGCTGNDTMAAINVIGTAAGWPEPSLDTVPGTPEGNQ